MFVKWQTNVLCCVYDSTAFRGAGTAWGSAAAHGDKGAANLKHRLDVELLMPIFSDLYSGLSENSTLL